jgi:Txe/YoeB family toxin of Txe-Axe toxin-antitoxin module
MRVHLTEQFIAQYDQAQPQIQKAVTKQLRLLKGNVRHPSLHAKKYDEARDIWQARITRDWRLYFIIKDDVYRIIEMKVHPK